MHIRVVVCQRRYHKTRSCTEQPRPNLEYHKSNNLRHLYWESQIMDSSASNHALDLASSSEGSRPSSHMSQHHSSTVVDQQNSNERDEQNTGGPSHINTAGQVRDLEILSPGSNRFATDNSATEHSTPDSSGSEKTSPTPSPIFSRPPSPCSSSASSVSVPEESDGDDSSTHSPSGSAVTEFTDLDTASDEDDSSHPIPSS